MFLCFTFEDERLSIMSKIIKSCKHCRLPFSLYLNIVILSFACAYVSKECLTFSLSHVIYANLGYWTRHNSTDRMSERTGHYHFSDLFNFAHACDICLWKFNSFEPACGWSISVELIKSKTVPSLTLMVYGKQIEQICIEKAVWLLFGWKMYVLLFVFLLQLASIKSFKMLFDWVSWW